MKSQKKFIHQVTTACIVKMALCLPCYKIIAHTQNRLCKKCICDKIKIPLWSGTGAIRLKTLISKSTFECIVIKRWHKECSIFKTKSQTCPVHRCAYNREQTSFFEMKNEKRTPGGRDQRSNLSNAVWIYSTAVHRYKSRFNGKRHFQSTVQ